MSAGPASGNQWLRELGSHLPSRFKLRLEGFAGAEIAAHYLDMRLFRERDQMGQNSHSVRILLDLAEHNIARSERLRNGGQIARGSRAPENCRISDHVEMPCSGAGHFDYHGIGQSIGEAVDLGLSGLVVEPGDGNPGGRYSAALAPPPQSDPAQEHRGGSGQPPSPGGRLELGRGLLDHIRPSYGRDELISAFGDGPNKPRRLRRISQSRADLGNAEIQAAIEVDERFRAPNRLPQRFPGDHLACVLEKQTQNLCRLGLQVYGDAIAMQNTSGGIEVENSKAQAIVAGHITSVAMEGGERKSLIMVLDLDGRFVEAATVMEQVPGVSVDPKSVGLCLDCANVKVIRSDRGPVYYLCGLAATNPLFRKYPPLPVITCSGYQPNRLPDPKPHSTGED